MILSKMEAQSNEDLIEKITRSSIGHDLTILKQNQTYMLEKIKVIEDTSSKILGKLSQPLNEIANITKNLDLLRNDVKKIHTVLKEIKSAVTSINEKVTLIHARSPIRIPLVKMPSAPDVPVVPSVQEEI